MTGLLARVGRSIGRWRRISPPPPTTAHTATGPVSDDRFTFGQHLAHMRLRDTIRARARDSADRSTTREVQRDG